MQLMPKNLIGSIGGAHLKDSKSVVFQPTPCEALESLTKYMTSGYVCIFFILSTPTLLYSYNCNAFRLVVYILIVLQLLIIVMSKF